MNLTYFLLITTAAIILFSAVLFLMFAVYAVIIGHLMGTPFVKSKKEKIKTMLELAEVKPGETIFDLGSGDGTILIEAARLGAKTVGLEINQFLVWFSKWRVKKLGLGKNIKIIRADFRNHPLAEADVVFLYLWPSTLEKLRAKLVEELKPGTRVISNGFVISDWRPVAENDKVYLYDLSSRS